jgi:hypothetical protein
MAIENVFEILGVMAENDEVAGIKIFTAPEGGQSTHYVTGLAPGKKNNPHFPTARWSST